MVFLKKRIVKGLEYYYAGENYSSKGKTVQKSVYYFGRNKPGKYEWQAVLNAVGGKDVYNPKNPEITVEQIKKVVQVNEDMNKQFASMTEIEKQNFQDKFFNEYIYNSNSIEGSTLNEKETYFVTHEKQGIRGKSLKEIYMARNLKTAIEVMEEYTGELTINLIKKMHSIVQENIQPKEELGQYKNKQNYIIGTEFFPTPPKLVEARMNGLMKWYSLNKKKYHPFELAALTHLKLVSIHPFNDGNGRTSRLIHNFILKKYNYNFIMYRQKTKQDYYSALRQAQVYSSHRSFINHAVKEFTATYEEY